MRKRSSRKPGKFDLIDRYGPIYHSHLKSPEVDHVRKHNHKAYMLWLHLQAYTFKDVDIWSRSMGAMARDLGCGASSLRRWARVLEEAGLLERMSKSLDKEQQRWRLVTPASVAAGTTKTATKSASVAAAAAELQADLLSIEDMIERYYAGNLDQKQARQRAELEAQAEALRFELGDLNM